MENVRHRLSDPGEVNDVLLRLIDCATEEITKIVTKEVSKNLAGAKGFFEMGNEIRELKRQLVDLESENKLTQQENEQLRKELAAYKREFADLADHSERITSQIKGKTKTSNMASSKS